MAIDDNAFPVENGPPYSEGLSKREYIATAILAGMLSHDSNGWTLNPNLPKEAVRLADKLIEELAR